MLMSAIGRRIAAAIPVRAITRNGGDTSPTAIRMKRYGMPQMTDISAKRTNGRLTTDPGARTTSVDVLRTPTESGGESAVDRQREA
jgi:hypothetical protein